MDSHLRAGRVIGAFSIAVAHRCRVTGLIHHSVRASQYTSLEFGAALGEAGILPSMGKVRSAFP